jgi:hypothetical protein
MTESIAVEAHLANDLLWHHTSGILQWFLLVLLSISVSNFRQNTYPNARKDSCNRSQSFFSINWHFLVFRDLLGELSAGR